jgi:hypothetical protein
MSDSCNAGMMLCPASGKLSAKDAGGIVAKQLTWNQKNLILIFLHEHFPGLQAQGLVPADGEKLGRLGSSFVSFTYTAFLLGTIIEMKANAHRVFGTTLTAKYVDLVLRHGQATSFSIL